MSVTALSYRSRRGALLALSLALNVFLVAVIGAHLLSPAAAPPDEGVSESPLTRLLAALPPHDAAEARAVLDRERPVYQAARARVTEAHQSVAAAIGRKPYDEAALRQAMAAWQTRWQDFATTFNGVFLDMVRPLSEQGRARLAAAVLAEDARHRAAR